MQPFNNQLKAKSFAFVLIAIFSVLTACGGGGDSKDNKKPTPAPKPTPSPKPEQILGTPRLNDTGITWGVTKGKKSDTCKPEHSQQDCAHGRDANKALNKDDNGYKGFNFTKLDATGKALKADAASWACVRDNVTKMVWEVKTTDGGTHDKKWNYYFYDSQYKDDNDESNGGDDNAHPGVDDATAKASAATTCGLTTCTTEALIKKVNTDGLCGIKDWKLPSMQALLSLVDFGRIKQKKQVDGTMQDYTGLIDERYFPNFITSWSSTITGYTSGFVFDATKSEFVEKQRNKDTKLPVRLVHIPAAK